ncbi:hypothetical protein BP6252_12977 [Coleophoma cylindrospora]|uniref:Velvet domain-containing protein n=1 Tax=Coleophoma cylindrospora TaxID=1849047 RepID=A0A3D8QE02_9HELO|nr:hypothetical protein BP6252_12977 [Coleophoma cylindrospora]
MLGLAVQPPVRARPGMALYPPPVATLSSNVDMFDELSRIWVVATLVQHNGDVVADRVTGSLSDSAHPMPRALSTHREQAYFCFPNLVIRCPGTYRLRITMMRMDNASHTASPVRVEEQVETVTITVADVECRQPKMTSAERSYLRALRSDGLNIPSPS